MKSLVSNFHCLLMLNLMLHCEQAKDYSNCPAAIDTDRDSGGFCFGVGVSESAAAGEAICFILHNTASELNNKERGWKRTEPVCRFYRWSTSYSYIQLKCFCAYGNLGLCMDEIISVSRSYFYGVNYCRPEEGKEIRSLLSRKTGKTTDKTAKTQSSSTRASRTKATGSKTPISDRTTRTAATTAIAKTAPSPTTATTFTVAAPTTTAATTTTTTATTFTVAAPTTTTATTKTTTTTTKTTLATTKTPTSTTPTTTSATTTPVSTFLTTTLPITSRTATTTMASPSTASTISTKTSSKSPNFTKDIKSTTILTEKSTKSVFIPTTVPTELPQVIEPTTTTEEPDETTTAEYYDPGRITTIWITREREYRRKLKELDNQLIERLAILFTLMTIILLIQARLFEKLRDHLEFYSYGQRRSVPPIP
uniref:Mucin-2-like n=2 Tax=Haemonchus contortus TaxID=6289 RepID=A0A7I4Y3I1_HAECO